jgi:hypothetical protein
MTVHYRDINTNISAACAISIHKTEGTRLRAPSLNINVGIVSFMTEAAVILDKVIEDAVVDTYVLVNRWRSDRFHTDIVVFVAYLTRDTGTRSTFAHT